MAVFKAIGSGIGTTSRKPGVLFTLWVFNLVYAALIVAPCYALIKADLGHSLFGRGLQLLDFLWLGEFIYRYQAAAPAMMAWVMTPLVLYVVLYIFLNGGIIGRLLDREGRTTLQAFFSDCARYSWRFVRLFIWSALFYVLAFGGVLAGLGRLLRPVVDQARTEWTPFWISGLQTIVALVLLSLVQMILDYARILVVAEDERRTVSALRKALGFIRRRFFRSWSLYLLVSAGFLAGAALYFGVYGLLPGSGLLWLGLGVFWGQAFIVFRLWIKMVFFSAQAEYFRLSSE